MPMCFAVAKSQNQATAFAMLLRRNGVEAELVAAPRRFSQKGCAYAVRFSKRFMSVAAKLLSSSGMDLKIDCD